METRLEAMRRAVETVRVPLETFYGSLSDDQKVQFDAMKPEPQVTRSASRNRRTVVSPAQVCRAQTLDYSAAFPEQEIEKSVQPTEAQKAALDELRTAVSKGPDLFKDTCPTEMPSTPTGRLAAVQARQNLSIAGRSVFRSSASPPVCRAACVGQGRLASTLPR